jgi:hypothetical protein
MIGANLPQSLQADANDSIPLADFCLLIASRLSPAS